MMHNAQMLVLSQVFWLGGSVCSGKTTISEMLATTYGLRVYHCDRHEAAHAERSQPDRHQTLAASNALTMDERWLLPSPEELAARSTQVHHERFEFIVEDLLAMPQDQPVLAEGYGLPPELVLPVLADVRHALWLISGPDFLTAMRYKRGMTAPALTSNPVRARAQLIERDILMAASLRQSVADQGLALLDIDGSLSIDETATRVARHFTLE